MGGNSNEGLNSEIYLKWHQAFQPLVAHKYLSIIKRDNVRDSEIVQIKSVVYVTYSDIGIIAF